MGKEYQESKITNINNTLDGIEEGIDHPQERKIGMRTERSWEYGREYIIEDTNKKNDDPVIKPKESGETSLARYNPFEFYKGDQGIHRLFDALKLSGSSGKKVSTRQSYERILGFVNKWGLLSKGKSELVRTFRIEQKIFHSVSVMAKAQHFHQTGDLIDALNEFSKYHWVALTPEIADEYESHYSLELHPGGAATDSHVFYYLDYDDGWDANEWLSLYGQWEDGGWGAGLWEKGEIPQDANPTVIYWLAGCLLESLTNRGRHGTRRLTDFHSDPIVTVTEFPSLLAAMYCMFDLDCEEMANWKVCQHKRCGKYYFAKNRPDYCSKKCAKAASQARWYTEDKRAIEAEKKKKQRAEKKKAEKKKKGAGKSRS